MGIKPEGNSLITRDKALEIVKQHQTGKIQRGR